MAKAEFYIFKQIGAAFLVTLLTLTGVVWVTQALREFDLVTSQGQTIWLFFQVTFLSLPLLILVIAPISLFIAIIWVLSKLNEDSELVVLNSSGFSPARLFRPVMSLALLVSLATAYLALSGAPSAMRELREIITQIRADVVANIVQEGKFVTLENNLTFHVQQRGSNGRLIGIFVNDARNPEEHVTLIAQRGQVRQNINGRSFLILEDGTMQRQSDREAAPTFVEYERYVFDLSFFSNPQQNIYYKPREKSLAELISPAPDDAYYRLQPGQFRAELHERIIAFFYPLMFALLAVMFLHKPQTNRQGRSDIIISLVICALLVRLGGLGLIGFIAATPIGVPFLYLLPLAVFIYGALVIFAGVEMKMPRFILWFHETITLRFIHYLINLVQRRTSRAVP